MFGVGRVLASGRSGAGSWVPTRLELGRSSQERCMSSIPAARGTVCVLPWPSVSCGACGFGRHRNGLARWQLYPSPSRARYRHFLHHRILIRPAFLGQASSHKVILWTPSVLNENPESAAVKVQRKTDPSQSRGPCPPHSAGPERSEVEGSSCRLPSSSPLQIAPYPFGEGGRSPGEVILPPRALKGEKGRQSNSRCQRGLWFT